MFVFSGMIVIQLLCLFITNYRTGDISGEYDCHVRHVTETYSGYGKYSDPLKFFTLCYIAAIC